MTQLTIKLANAWELETAKNLVESQHYLGDHLIGCVILAFLTPQNVTAGKGILGSQLNA